MLKKIILEMALNILDESKKKQSYYIDGNGVAVMQIPMTFASMRPKKTKLDESRALIHDDDEDEEHGHVSKGLTQTKPFDKMSAEKMSNHLHDHYGSHVSPKDSKHIKHYTKTEPSKTISKALNDSHRWGHEPTRHMDDEEEKTHKAIRKNVKPSKEEFHVYHGASANVGRATSNAKNGLVHFPSHLSTTHDKDTAEYFAQRAAKTDRNNRDANNYHHIMKIKIKKGDKILHVSRHSETPEEHETIIPSGTTLKHTGTTYHHHEGQGLEGAERGKKYRVAVHHYEVHKQE